MDRSSPCGGCHAGTLGAGNAGCRRWCELFAPSALQHRCSQVWLANDHPQKGVKGREEGATHPDPCPAALSSTANTRRVSGNLGNSQPSPARINSRIGRFSPTKSSLPLHCTLPICPCSLTPIATPSGDCQCQHTIADAGPGPLLDVVCLHSAVRCCPTRLSANSALVASQWRPPCRLWFLPVQKFGSPR